MTGPHSKTALDAQLKAAPAIAHAIITALTTERGVHAETAVAAAARMGGTFLFRTFGLPTSGLAPGSPVLSDVANVRGPMLVEVLQSGLAGLGVDVAGTPTQAQLEEHRPQMTLLDSQRLLDGPLGQVAAEHGLDEEGAARACALGAAHLIAQAQSILDPAVSFGVAVDGFVEGTKTVPLSSAASLPKQKPWFKLW